MPVWLILVIVFALFFAVMAGLAIGWSKWMSRPEKDDDDDV